MSGAKDLFPNELSEKVSASSTPDSAFSSARRFRFASFEADVETRELRNRGIRVALQQKPFQILEIFLRAPGALIRRTELVRQLWPGLHVNFDHSLNTAMNALRQALGDSPQNCRFIETRPGLGYRFIAPVEEIQSDAEQIRQPTRAGTKESPGALQDYLTGRFFYNKMTEDALRKAVAYFEASIRHNPDFALAYAGLADTFSLFALWGAMPRSEAHARVVRYTDRAFALDVNLPEAHGTLGSIRRLFEWNWPLAEESFRRALHLDPRYAAGHAGYGIHLAAMGKSTEALASLRKANEFDPLSLKINMEFAWALYMARDFEGALQQSWKTLALEPAFPTAQHTLGLAYEQMGMMEDAITEFQNSCTCSSDQPFALAALGHAYAKADRPEDAAKTLEYLKRLATQRFVSPYWISIIQVALGQNQLALEMLDRAHQERDVWLGWMGVDPRFDPLQSEPRFGSLLRSLNLFAYSTKANGS